MRFGSLFSGIGGFDLGLERAGMTCAWQCEIDKHCNEVLQRHWPNVKRYEDVRTIGKHNLEPVDVICGGFPCQDLSVAGRREGLAGKRSGLWYEFHRILEETRPGLCIIENVPGLLSSHKGRDFAQLLRGLVECGYGVCWRILDAQYFGVAQRRRRVFLIGSLGNGRAAQILFERESGAWDSAPSREAGKGVAGTVNAGAHPGSYNGQDAYTNNLITAATLNSGGGNGGFHSEPGEHLVTIDVRNLREQPDGISETLQGKKSGGYSLNYTNPIAYNIIAMNGNEKWRHAYPTDVTNTLDGWSGTADKNGGGTVICSQNPEVIGALDSGGSGGDNAHGGAWPGMTVQSALAGHSWATSYGVRRLTPTECERLQGFPDGWTAEQSDSSRYRQLGNAVAVPVIEWIGKRMMKLA